VGLFSTGAEQFTTHSQSPIEFEYGVPSGDQAPLKKAASIKHFISGVQTEPDQKANARRVYLPCMLLLDQASFSRLPQRLHP
jgi:hypothetical protein